MPDVLMATHNAGKIREMRRIAAGGSITWRGLDEFPDVPKAIEDADTFIENARKKALHYAAATGLLTLADDSGLEVDCLDGAPGVHSARYAGVAHDFAANNRKLAAAVAGVPREKCTARFRCVMVFARPGEVLAETEGAAEGLIVVEPRGKGGFGFDPHFFVPSLKRTMAELTPDEKNAISHRGKALRDMLPRIDAFLEQEKPLPKGAAD